MANKDQVVIDLTNYKDKVGDRLPEGRYRVIVADADLDKSNAGNQMINIWLDVVDGEHQGATIVDRLTLTEKALFRVVGFMKAIGLQTPKKRLQVNIGSWIGRTLMIDVEDGDPYNGRIKSEVRGYNRAAKSSASEQAADLPSDFQPSPGAQDDPWATQDEPSATSAPADESDPAAFERGLSEFADKNGLKVPTGAEVDSFAQRAAALGVETEAEVPDVVDLDSLNL